MSETPPAVADFDRPPVVEVAISVQFEALTAFRTAHVGTLWNEFRARFPKLQDQPPLPPILETFGPPAKPNIQAQAFISGPMLSLDVPQSWPAPRSLFLNENGDQVIQVQSDRLLFNWRKAEGSAVYPRYSRMREEFRTTFETFSALMQREQVGTPRPNQCEIVYVNHIISGEGWERHGQIGEVLNITAPGYGDELLREPENVSFQASYVIPANSGEPLGRLYLTVQAARTRDNIPMFVLQVTARGRPEGDGSTGALAFLDRGHQWARRGFVLATSPRMHEIWGIHRVN